MKQRNFGIQLSNFVTKKNIVSFLLAGGVSLFLICGYILVLQPILCRYIIPTTDIHQGSHYFSDNSFLKFESGDTFSQLINDMEFDTLGNVMDFYHVDNQVYDNPFYGKHCDVFALDVQMEHSAFLQYQEEIASKAQECGDLENFKLYLIYTFDSTVNEQGEVVLIAFGEERKMVRLILLTDKDEVSLPSGYISTLFQNSSLSWE